jgi:hypothetical protein
MKICHLILGAMLAVASSVWLAAQAPALSNIAAPYANLQSPVRSPGKPGVRARWPMAPRSHR